ncbi:MULTISPECIES: hypothetical protein [Jannaschia]|uniref:hypothetical protein n=1 Tax=Jannaschia TaxID=188905 RepID=UPI001C7CCED0|nr:MULTISPECIES: hypothetical protein [unclassified Jannaschia]
MRGAAGLLLVGLAGCGGNAPGPSATDFVGTDAEVSPGLASCVTAIGRPDLATDPDASMTNDEIEALLTCTAERARG